jgi:HPt (histidine-containing phosphotransfer) domain-containing protein
VIGKINAPRGERVEGLIYYLFGPGRQEEHTDPHIVAGWRHPAELEPPLRPDGRRDFRRLLGLLNQPHAAMGTWGLARPVWHCSMRAAPTDKMLSDEEWAQIACDVMHRTGLSPFGHEDDAVRWVAIRHGDDHIHLVAMLARQDGRRPHFRNDRYRVRDACLAAEQRYGLQRTAPGDRTAARRAARAESEKATRRGLEEAPRVTLRRQVSTASATAANELEFFARLRQSGALVRTRSSTRNTGEITGYAVALPGDTTKAGEPVWYGGGKLAADLTLPKLRRRWTQPGNSAGDRFTVAERSAVWEHAARAADRACSQIQALAANDPAGAADAAWATADTLHAAAAALGSRILRQAADAFDRAARAPYGRIPAPTPAGDSLRRAARLLSAYGYLTSDPSFRPIVLITRLAALAEAIAELRQTQERVAQAASALSAAERLHAAETFYAGHATVDRHIAQTAAALAGAGFPASPRPIPAGEPAPAPATPGTAPPVSPRPGHQSRRH